MLYFILIIAVVVLFALWRVEASDCDEVMNVPKMYRDERDEEFRFRRKAECEVDRIKAVCEALSRENANIYSEREKLKKCTVEYALTDWDKRVCEDIPGREEYERDGIVLIYEDGKIVGWHSADTVQICFKNVPDVVPGNEDDAINELPPREKADEGGEEISSIGEGTCVEDDTQGTYEAPSAEVVIANVGGNEEGS